jgi:hypothetical protein
MRNSRVNPIAMSSITGCYRGAEPPEPGLNTSLNQPLAATCVGQLVASVSKLANNAAPPSPVVPEVHLEHICVLCLLFRMF